MFHHSHNGRTYYDNTNHFIGIVATLIQMFYDIREKRLRVELYITTFAKNN